MDRQAQDYSYTQPPQYGYTPQPQNYPQQAYMAPPQFPPYAGPHQQFYPPQPPLPYATSAPPPFDPELQKRIDKLVEYTAKNGPDFESMIREKQSNNPDYSFLFGGEGYNYYRYKLLTSTSFAPVSYHPTVPPPPYQQPVYEQPPLYRPGGFTGLRSPLPADVAVEVEAALGGLTGTKESIKAAKSWFMQRALFAPALADTLRDRVLALDDPERQLHVIFLANDILFESLQHRANPRELDNEARALLPVLGSMLCRVYHNPINQEENQSRLMKIVQFWASKQVFDPETISNLEREMVSGIGIAGTVPVPNPYSVPMPDTSGFVPHNWQHDNMQASIPAHQTPFSVPIPIHQPPFPVPVPTHQTPYPVPVPVATQPPVSVPVSAPTDSSLPPYPLFPPGLIPGMVRKTQIGSGVPYSPLSPLDIPTIIPPSPILDSKIREKVSQFFKEIGEINPSEGEYEEDERESPVRKGGVSIAPPVGLNDVDPETGMCADGSVPGGTGTGRLGLGAGTDDASSQYDDVYSSYRKNMSTSYHTFMSTRADTRS